VSTNAGTATPSICWRMALLLTVTDLGGQLAGAVAAAVLDPGLPQLVRGVRVIQVVLGDHGLAATDPVVER
jgi:hypothetical protein